MTHFGFGLKSEFKFHIFIPTYLTNDWVFVCLQPMFEGSQEENPIFQVPLSPRVHEDPVMGDRDHQRLNQLASFRLHQALQHISSHRLSPQQTQQVLAAEGKVRWAHFLLTIIKCPDILNHIKNTTASLNIYDYCV